MHFANEVNRKWFEMQLKNLSIGASQSTTTSESSQTN